MNTDKEFDTANNEEATTQKSSLKAFWISNDTHALFKEYCKKKGTKMMTQGDLIVLEFLERASEEAQ